MTVFPRGFKFSQSNLQDYRDCARRFELRHLQRRQYPAPVAEPLEALERHRQRGEHFHRLVQQHQSGIDEGILTRSVQDDEVQGWWQSYLAFAKAHLTGVGRRFAELSMYTEVEGHRLTAKYDLVSVNDGRVVIFDWKTSQFKPKRSALEQRLQSIVYPFVMAQAGGQLLGAREGSMGIDPSRIEMWYWFTAAPAEPEKFAYDAAKYTADHDVIADYIREISARTHFEKTQNLRHCNYCVYRSLCDRGQRAGDADVMGEYSEADTFDTEIGDFKFDFDQVAEVEF